ncbi:MULTISPECIES: hypothetical protein [Halobacterium]|uniref:hypothetical protein n=1 Tax=Halobacterium TaxID=2239 RepID=UPI001E4156DD|nr:MULTISPECIES: hypothetical protein [Halobacterium]MDL0123634.1 hypothetical protein [Halobacterium salinarum]UDF60550.1 hypothetical protein JRZ79_13345 [Halobacterium sp. BOL4-2]
MTRKSKREIARQPDQIENGTPSEYPKLDTLAELLSYDWEMVDEENRLWERQEDGKEHYFPEGFEQAIESALFEDS